MKLTRSEATTIYEALQHQANRIETGNPLLSLAMVEKMNAGRNHLHAVGGVNYGIILTDEQKEKIAELRALAARTLTWT